MLVIFTQILLTAQKNYTITLKELRKQQIKGEISQNILLFFNTLFVALNYKK